MTLITHDHITSTKNQHVQRIRELLAKKANRESTGLYVIEGVRLCEEALKSGLLPELTLYSENCSARGIEIMQHAQKLDSKVISVTDSVLNSISDTETSQGLLMIVPNTPLELPQGVNFVLILDQLRDPGNLGTILRTACAAGVQAVFCTPGSVDPYSPKVVRSAMGAHFQTPIITRPWKEIQEYCAQQNPQLRTLLAESGGGSPLWKSDLRSSLALVIGGEAEGASAEVKASVDGLVNIPMPGGFESLNAAVAASIILFEVVRQRQA
jgi:TrmH family RNA methyltransferase